MQIERNRRNGNSYSHPFSNGSTVDGGGDRTRQVESRFISPSPSYSVAASSAASPAGANYIEHRVSRMDTLAGVAIKYGVEVADIKRMNGLVTDLQMFAHKFLQIPLPGRHPPSPILENGSSCNGEKTPPRRHRGDVLELFESLKLKPPQRRVSPAMSTLQGYYGLKPPKRVPAPEGTEMAVYRTGRALYLEDEPLPRTSPVSEPPPTRHRKSRSLVNGFLAENGKFDEDIVVAEAGESSEADRSYSDNSVRRRPKTDTEPPLDIGGALSGRTGKGLALRPKSGSRTDLDTFGDYGTADGIAAVRKSSSTSNLQESDNNSSSIWPTSKWTLKPESITRPIFDGLPKPMGARRNKAALD